MEYLNQRNVEINKTPDSTESYDRLLDYLLEDEKTQKSEAFRNLATVLTSNEVSPEWMMNFLSWSKKARIKLHQEGWNPEEYNGFMEDAVNYMEACFRKRGMTKEFQSVLNRSALIAVADRNYELPESGSNDSERLLPADDDDKTEPTVPVTLRPNDFFINENDTPLVEGEYSESIPGMNFGEKQTGEDPYPLIPEDRTTPVSGLIPINNDPYIEYEFRNLDEMGEFEAVLSSEAANRRTIEDPDRMHEKGETDQPLTGEVQEAAEGFRIRAGYAIAAGVAAGVAIGIYSSSPKISEGSSKPAADSLSVLQPPLAASQPDPHDAPGESAINDTPKKLQLAESEKLLSYRHMICKDEQVFLCEAIDQAIENTVIQPKPGEDPRVTLMNEFLDQLDAYAEKNPKGYETVSEFAQTHRSVLAIRPSAHEWEKGFPDTQRILESMVAQEPSKNRTP
jgi:hypothetical protein